MKRQPSPSDFEVNVPDVGRFVFAKRTMRDEIAIQREYANILQGVEHPTVWLNTIGGWFSALRSLTVEAPADWDLDTLDPLDPKTYAKLNAVYTALTEKEHSFRHGQGLAVQTGSAG